MNTKTMFAAFALLVIAGIAPAAAEDGPGLVGWTEPTIHSGAGVTAPAYDPVETVLDAQRRCAAAINGEQPHEIASRCGLEG